MGAKGIRPGKATPVSGIYENITNNGRRTGEQVTSTQGKPLPPTSQPGQGWVLVEPAKHKPTKK